MNDQQMEPCTNCKGAGRVLSLIEDTTYKCGRCGGHKTIPVSGVFWFYKPMAKNYYLSQQIAGVREEQDGRWLITFFRPDGPSRDSLEKREEVFGQLREFRASRTAPRLLDHWSKGPKWAHGLKQLKWVSLSNLIFNKGDSAVRESLHNAIHANKSLDDVLALAHKLKREHLPECDIW